MNISTLGRQSKNCAYILFFVLPVVLGITYWDPKENVSSVPLVVMLAVAFVWQAFTVYHHREFLMWILTILYGIAVIVAVLD